MSVPRLRAALTAGALAVLLGLVGCSKKDSPRGSTVAPVSPTAPDLLPVMSDVLLSGAGDIGECGSPGLDATANLLDGIPGAVFTAGDNAYMHGSLRDFQQCFDRTWGRHRERMFPTPGNHEYETPNAAGYFSYFGERAGPPGLGYYSFELGAWHVVSLNSNVPAGEGSQQLAWLRNDLRAVSTPCVAAIWHHPLYSSGPNGDNANMRDVWRVLTDAGADLAITSHDHLYERQAAHLADGRIDPRGMRSFIVGTGGAHLYERGGSARPMTEVRVLAWGVIKLTLSPGRYRWEFVSTNGIQDSGVDRCH